MILTWQHTLQQQKLILTKKFTTCFYNNTKLSKSTYPKIRPWLWHQLSYKGTPKNYQMALTWMFLKLISVIQTYSPSSGTISKVNDSHMVLTFPIKIKLTLLILDKDSIFMAGWRRLHLHIKLGFEYKNDQYPCIVIRWRLWVELLY